MIRLNQKQSVLKHSVAIVLLCILSLPLYVGAKGLNYRFDKRGIQRTVLENYLDRSITLSCVLVPDSYTKFSDNREADDNTRMVKNIGAKFIGRSIFCWENEKKLYRPTFWSTAQAIIRRMHSTDPELVFQACLFEAISTDVDSIPVPDWVFKGFNLPVEKRNFSYQSMLNTTGKYVDFWHKGGSVPDISQLETRLWFYYLACSYIHIGCEALHLGQIELIGMNDPDRTFWKDLITHVRMYASKNARRHWVILDAHTPKGGMLKDGVSLLDFNSFPMRICAIPGHPAVGEPQKAELRANHLDGIYKKSKGCKTPTGWSCEHLPYLVEIDNYGHEAKTDVADTTSYFPWGWDEISWYAKQPESYRNEWLHYAWNWMKRTDKDGHIEMPGLRGICCPNQTNNLYKANTKSDACPNGYSQEETIKEIWSNDK